jgi:hypothetical protein
VGGGVWKNIADFMKIMTKTEPKPFPRRDTKNKIPANRGSMAEAG